MLWNVSEKNMRRIEREGGVELLMQILTKYGLEHESNAVAQNLFKSLQMEDTVNWEDISLIRKIGEGKYGDVYKVSVGTIVRRDYEVLK